jgi:hypothetical protein
MIKSDKEIADYLGKNGEIFCEELHNRSHHFFRTLPHSYFAIACAISLSWTGHAKYDDDFVLYASAYIDAAIPKDTKIAKVYSLRFGEEGLDTALTNFRIYLNRVKGIMPDFDHCSIQDINVLQQRLLNKLSQLRDKGEVVGIGPWLFLGAFKIILEDQKRFWQNDGIDAIVMPTGLEVDRGIMRLKNEGYSFMKDFDLHWLEENKGTLSDNYATCIMVHSHIVKIAKISGTTALHINSALYKYGRREL